MAALEIDANTFHQFSIDRLCVTPELLGVTHQFLFSGQKIVISLPVLDKDTVPIDRRRVECWKWKADGHVPLEYMVNGVDMEIETNQRFQIPEELLLLSPNQFDLVGPEERKRLDQTVRSAEDVSRNAFEYWMSVLRWKSRIGHIGEPRVRYASDSGGGAVLRERTSGKRLWLGPRIIVAEGRRPVTIEHWSAAQATLAAGKSSPVWFKFLFDSEQRANNNDLTGSVLSLAIALEVNVRRVFSKGLQDVEPMVMEVLDQANLRSLLNRMTKLTYWSDEWKQATDLSIFNQLMTRRDKIMHSAMIEELSLKELRRMHAAVQRFAYFTCDFLGLS